MGSDPGPCRILTSYYLKSDNAWNESNAETQQPGGIPAGIGRFKLREPGTSGQLCEGLS